MDFNSLNVSNCSRKKVKYIIYNLMTQIGKKLKSKLNNLFKPKERTKMTDQQINIKSIIKATVKYTHRLIALIIHGILWLMFGGPGETMPPITDFILLESASSLAYKIRTKKLKSVRVLEAFIERIKEVNPILNCVVDERFEDALKEAEHVDKMIESGILDEKTMESEKPFLGVPITTKDCLSVKGMKHTAGLYCRRDVRGTEDSDAIALLRKAGAIPIALTNVSELCMWWESSNTVHGRTNNPYNTHRIVGGSSGGEGCLQAAAGSPFGVGSDIGGSIRMPAFFNGVFGHKPSKDIVPIKGQYPLPFSAHQSSYLGVGPLCRFSSDLKPMLKIISGPNASKLDLDSPVDLRNVKIYYQENDGGCHLVSPVDSEIISCIHKFLKHMQRAHNVKPEKLAVKRLKISSAIWLANIKSKESPGFACQLTDLKGEINVALEFVKWLFRLSNHTFIGLATALADKSGVQVGSSHHQYLVEQRNHLEQELSDILQDNAVFIYPTHPTPAPFHNEPVINPLNFSYTAIINCLGFPATACPMGLSSTGLPLGFQVISGLHQDRLCLAVAREVERAFGGWVTPPVKF